MKRIAIGSILLAEGLSLAAFGILIWIWGINSGNLNFIIVPLFFVFPGAIFCLVFGIIIALRGKNKGPPDNPDN